MQIEKKAVVRLIHEKLPEDDLQAIGYILKISPDETHAKNNHERINHFVDRVAEQNSLMELLQKIDQSALDDLVGDYQAMQNKADFVIGLFGGSVLGFVTNVVTSILFGQLNLTYVGIVLVVFTVFLGLAIFGILQRMSTSRKITQLKSLTRYFANTSTGRRYVSNHTK